MPTVDLGESTEGASAWRPSGSRASPVPEYQRRTINAHLAETGGTVFKTENLDEKETAASSSWPRPEDRLPGQPLVAENGRVVGFAVPEAGSALHRPRPAGSSTPTRSARC